MTLFGKFTVSIKSFYTLLYATNLSMQFILIKKLKQKKKEKEKFYSSHKSLFLLTEIYNPSKTQVLIRK